VIAAAPDATASAATPFQCSNPLLKHILRGIGKTSVDIARILQTEPGCGMICFMEHIG
jgi:hypothetical protein